MRTVAITTAVMAMVAACAEADSTPESVSRAGVGTVDSTETTTSATATTTTTAALDTVPPDTAPTDTEPNDTAPTNIAPTVATDASWLTTVLDGERGPLGWPVPAGDWTTDAFSAPITFTTTAELSLVGVFRDFVLFRDPNSSDVHFLVIARAAFLKDRGNSGPVPADPDEITELIRSLPDVELLDLGQHDTAEARWWDITVTNFSDGAPYGCELGDACGPIGFTQDSVSVDTLENETSRIYRAEIDGERIGVYVTGPTAGREALIDVADDIVDSLVFASPAAAQPATTFFGTLGTSNRYILSGRYISRFPNATLAFDLPEALDGYEIELNRVNTIWITNGDAALALIPANRLIDPTADQLDMRGPEPVFTYVDPPISDNDEFVAWSEATHRSVSDVIDGTVGGLDAIFLDDDASGDGQRTDNTYPCDDPTSGTACYTTFTSDGLSWYAIVDGDGVGRTAFVADANLIMIVVGFGGSTHHDALRTMQPLIDALTIEPVDR